MKAKLLDYLDNQARVFKKQGRKTFKNPSPESVHKLRVNVRRIRAVIWLSEHGDPKLSFKKLSSSLRRLSRSLGEIRQLDVAVKDAKTYKLTIANLNCRFQPIKKRLHNEIDRKHRIKIFHQIKKASRKIEKHPELNLAMAISKLEDVHFAQAINYLEAYNLEIGLLINFGEMSLNFKRLTNKKFKA